MLESEYNALIDETLLSIEDAVDASEFDIDFDTIAGILTLEFTDQSKIIINRQAALSQLWIAARSGGYHLDYIDGRWFCKSADSSLQPLIDRLCSEQAGVTVHLAL